MPKVSKHMHRERSLLRWYQFGWNTLWSCWEHSSWHYLCCKVCYKMYVWSKAWAAKCSWTNRLLSESYYWEGIDHDTFTENLRIDNFLYPNSSGISGLKMMDDSVCLESRAGYAMMVVNYLIQWWSTFQSQTTMDAEILLYLIAVANYIPLWMEPVSWVKPYLPIGSTNIHLNLQR